MLSRTQSQRDYIMNFQQYNSGIVPSGPCEVSRYSMLGSCSGGLDWTPACSASQADVAASCSNSSSRVSKSSGDFKVLMQQPRSIIDPAYNPRGIIDPLFQPRGIIDPIFQPRDIIDPAFHPRGIIDPSFQPQSSAGIIDPLFKVSGRNKKSRMMQRNKKPGFVNMPNSNAGLQVVNPPYIRSWNQMSDPVFQQSAQGVGIRMQKKSRQDISQFDPATYHPFHSACQVAMREMQGQCDYSGLRNSQACINATVGASDLCGLDMNSGRSPGSQPLRESAQCSEAKIDVSQQCIGSGMQSKACLVSQDNMNRECGLHDMPVSTSSVGSNRSLSSAASSKRKSTTTKTDLLDKYPYKLVYNFAGAERKVIIVETPFSEFEANPSGLRISPPPPHVEFKKHDKFAHGFAITFVADDHVEIESTWTLHDTIFFAQDINAGNLGVSFEVESPCSCKDSIPNLFLHADNAILKVKYSDINNYVCRGNVIASADGILPATMGIGNLDPSNCDWSMVDSIPYY